MRKKEYKELTSKVKEILSSRIVETKKELADLIDIGISDLNYLLQKEGICLMPKRWHTGNKIFRAYKQGYKKVKEISEITGLNISTVSKYKRKLGLPFERIYPKIKKGNRIMEIKKTQRIPLRDRLISQGRTLIFIGKKEGVKRETIRQYILKTGQYTFWRKQREKRKKELENIRKYHIKKKKLLSDIITKIIDRKREEIYEDEWAIEKTREYLSIHQNTKRNFEEIYNVLYKYHRAKEKGIKMSLKELGQEKGIIPTYVGRILKDINLKSLHFSCERHRTPKWKKQAMKRAYNFSASCSDIAYFLKLPYHVVYQNEYYWFGKRPEIKRPIRYFEGGKRLTYAKASQIYEAQDSGFSKKETAELTDMPEITIDYCNQHPEIKTKIINLIELLYQTKTDKPYLDGSE
jgi:hypothetical protein